jgi:DNA-binding beta-propeller fold protein YncE
MSTLTSHGTLAVDGHIFDRFAPVWSDTEVYHLADHQGADYTLVAVDGSWAWWAQVNQPRWMTLRMETDSARHTTPHAAFEQARAAVNQWQALHAW